MTKHSLLVTNIQENIDESTIVNFDMSKQTQKLLYIAGKKLAINQFKELLKKSKNIDDHKQPICLTIPNYNECIRLAILKILSNKNNYEIKS